MHGALLTAAGRWALVAVAVTAAVALALAVPAIRRPSRRSPAQAAARDPALEVNDLAGDAPPARAGGRPDDE